MGKSGVVELVDMESGMLSPPASPKAKDLSPMEIVDKTSNPAPIGLCAFGMTTILLNLHNAGLFGLDSMILAMGLCYGGTAQVIAGIMEFYKGNTFGSTAFTSYGFFWLSLVVLVVAPETGGLKHATKPSLASWFMVWGIFTAVLWFGTLKLNRALQIIFGLLTLLFVLLTVAEISGLRACWIIAGIEGVACGAAALYTGLAQVVNEVHGRTVMPVDRAPAQADPKLQPQTYTELAPPSLGGRSRTAP